MGGEVSPPASARLRHSPLATGFALGVALRAAIDPQGPAAAPVYPAAKGPSARPRIPRTGGCGSPVGP